MADHRTMLAYRRLYAILLRMYPRGFRVRFAESMEQTFHDLCRDRQATGKSLFGYVLRLFAETLAGILRERTVLIMPARRTLVRLAAITAAFLTVPFVAMRFSDEVNWSPFDFIVAGTLVFGTGLAFEVIVKRMRGNTYRLAVGLALATGFLLIWVNLAVGIIGSDDNSANALYLGVLAIGGVGAAISRLHPNGMARTMFATGVAQILVPLVALLIFRPPVQGDDAVTELIGVLFLNTAFALLFIGSGTLFRMANTRDSAGSPAQPAATD